MLMDKEEDITMKKTYKIEVDCAACALKMEDAEGHLKEADRQGAFGTKRLHHRQTETGSRKGQSRKGCRPCRQGESRSRATIY